MAISSTKSYGFNAKAPNTPGSVQSDFVVFNSDATVAQSSAEMIALYTIPDASFRWWKVPEGATSACFAGLCNSSTTGVTTDPVIRIFGLKNAGDFSDPIAGADPIRLDSPADIAATGITVDFGTLVGDNFVVSDDGSTPAGYMSRLTNASGYDLQGCSYVGVCVETAAVLAGTGATCQIVGYFL